MPNIQYGFEKINMSLSIDYSADCLIVATLFGPGNGVANEVNENLYNNGFLFAIAIKNKWTQLQLYSIHDSRYYTIVLHSEKYFTVNSCIDNTMLEMGNYRISMFDS